MNPGSSSAVDTGSFRNRDGRIYTQGDRIIRGVSASALAEFKKLESTAFYTRFLQKDQLVGSELLSPENVNLPPEIMQKWARFIEHRRIPVITYPYEWTFGMLRDAALLQLDLVEAAFTGVHVLRRVRMTPACNQANISIVFSSESARISISAKVL